MVFVVDMNPRVARAQDIREDEVVGTPHGFRISRVDGQTALESARLP